MRGLPLLRADVPSFFVGAPASQSAEDRRIAGSAECLQCRQQQAGKNGQRRKNDQQVAKQVEQSSGCVRIAHCTMLPRTVFIFLRDLRSPNSINFQKNRAFEDYGQPSLTRIWCAVVRVLFRKSSAVLLLTAPVGDARVPPFYVRRVKWAA
jgi:hypothetical protein